MADQVEGALQGNGDRGAGERREPWSPPQLTRTEAGQAELGDVSIPDANIWS